MGMIIDPYKLAPAGGGNPYEADTLILHWDGPDASTTFTDSGPLGLTVTTLSAAEIDTAQSVFGGSSMRIPGVDDGAQLALSGDRWHLTADSSFECFIRLHTLPSSSGQSNIIAGLRRPATGSRGWQWGVSTSNVLTLTMWDTSGSVQLSLAGSTTLSVDTWYHVGISRDSSGDVYLWLEGAVEDSGTPSGTSSDGYELTIGFDRTNSNRWFRGWIEEFAVNKGAERDLSDVPTEEFQAA